MPSSVSHLDESRGLPPTRQLALNVIGHSCPRPFGRLAGRWSHDDGSPRGQAYAGPFDCWLDWHGVGLFRFSRHHPTVDVWPSARVEPARLQAIFAHEIQPLVLQALGYETMHGGSASGPAGAVALCGKSGAGKSTLAYALSRRGWSQFSDDHIIIDFDNEQPRLRTLPFQTRLRPASAAHFGDWSERHANRRERDSAPLAAVLIVEQVPSLTEWMKVTPIPPAAAFPALLPHAHAFDPHDSAETNRLVRHYLALVDSVPVYSLRYRPDFSRLDQLVDVVSELRAFAGR